MFFKNFFFEISSTHSFSEILLYRTKFSIYFESQKFVSQKLLFYFRKKDISEFHTYKHVNSIPKLHKQYDIKIIVILQDFPKLIAETLNSFFSKLVNNEIRLYRTQPTMSLITSFSCHVLSCPVMSCNVLSYYVSYHVFFMPCSVMSCNVLSYYVSYHVFFMSCPVMSFLLSRLFHVMSCHVISLIASFSCHVLSCLYKDPLL